MVGATSSGGGDHTSGPGWSGHPGLRTGHCNLRIYLQTNITRLYPLDDSNLLLLKLKPMAAEKYSIIVKDSNLSLVWENILKLLTKGSLPYQCEDVVILSVGGHAIIKTVSLHPHKCHNLITLHIIAPKFH